MVHVSLMFLSEWREFPLAPCLAGKEKNLMTAHVSMLSKSHTLPDMLPFSLCNKKRLAVRHMNRPIFPTTHREVGQAKDISAPPCIFSLLCAMCPAHLILLDVNTCMMFAR